jgi:outer membrane immunogenic protein
MRRIALSVLALSSIVGSTAALAADLPPAAPPPPRAPAVYIPAPPPFSWTGFYVGINGGYDWGQATSNGVGIKSKGGLAGVTVGYNYQISQFVIGVEGDFDWSGAKFSNSVTSNFGPGAFNGGNIVNTVNTSYSNNWLSTFAARFGFAADHALIYAKAGGAWTQDKWNVNGAGVDAIGPQSGSMTGTFSRLGWMVGGGLEYAVLDNVTLKLEYNYIDFGSNTEQLTITNNPAADPLFPPAFNGPTPVKLNMSVVKAGVNVLFH